ncbi:hypothetical protein ACFQDD_02000 [Halorubrum pallidum]|uniref:Uncharacterized protein n=1 Tax=Halorubrum pallidum TaxID=1526114 RepID=A0ABD5SYK0_9EURY
MLIDLDEYESIEAWHEHRVEEHEKEEIGSEPFPVYLTAELPNGEMMALSAEAVADRAAGERVRDLDIDDESERRERFAEIATELEHNPEELVDFLRTLDVDAVRRAAVRIIGDRPTMSELWDNAKLGHTSIDEPEMLPDGGAGTVTAEEEKYRVESADDRHAGFSGTEDGAKRMARECDRHNPDDAPHHVRRVPETAVHEEGGPYPIIYNTEDGDVDA